MGSWTTAGFTAKTLDYYKTQIQQVFVDAFGSDFILDDALPQGVLIQELAELFYNMDMDGIEVLSRLNLNTATGIYLDLIGQLRGIYRILGTYGTVQVDITSSATSIPFTIPASTTFTCVETGETFTTTSATYVESTSASVSLQCSSRGSFSAAISNTMTVDIANITDVTITAVENGEDTEDDLTYRGRLQRENAVTSNSIQSVLDLLLAASTVSKVGVNYNDTSSTVGTLPAYSTEFMVVKNPTSSDSVFKEQVAKIIINNKVPGSPTAGNTTQTVTDMFGTNKSVNFTIPTEKVMQIQVTVTSPATGSLNLTRALDIKESIAEYINGLNIGDDISFSRCMAPLTADGGFDVSEFKIKSSSDTTWTTNANYSIGDREYASIQISNISIGA